MTVRKQKAFLLIFSIFLLSFFGGRFFFGYFTDGDLAMNKTTIGGSDIRVNEEFPTPDSVEKGSVFIKKVSVTNHGPNDCFVRVKAVFSTSDIENYASVNWNEDDFVYDPDDGYWYYRDLLKSGEDTSCLFTEVSISDDIPSAALTDFDIIIYAEGYMSNGYATYQNAWDTFRINRQERWSW